MAENKMFCFQCQETAKGTGCTIQGVCGKKAETSRWQDLLLGVVRGVATISDSLRNAGIKTNQEVGDYIVDALFATITNANFDDQAILNSHPLKTIFQHKACTDKLYADSFYKVQKNSHSSFEVICCRS